MITYHDDISYLAKQIFLKPGDFYFSSSGEHITTILGSCIAITLWHPVLHIGGMCHFVMPAASVLNLNYSKPSELNGYYAEDAMLLFKNAVESRGTSLISYEAKVFGGGHSQSAAHSVAESVGHKNTIAAKVLLKRHGITIKATHLGENKYRRLIFNTTTGDVWLKHERIG
jgi:chemotaxis protein CheD